MADDCSNMEEGPSVYKQREIEADGGNTEEGSTSKIVHIKIAEELEKWTKGMVETSAFKKVLEMLKNGKTWITIKGSPGEGKTTAAKMALKELQKSGRRVFQVRSPEDFTEVTKTCSKPVIMLDDILGDIEFDHTAWLRWKEIFHNVLDVKLHKSHEWVKTTSDKKEVTVLLVGRDYVLKGAVEPMGRLYNYISHNEHIVDMSHPVIRTLDEKQQIWDAIVGQSGINIAQQLVRKIFDFKGSHGFPHICHLFVTLYQENSNLSAENFFEKPLYFLNETIRTFLINRSKLTLFKEMLKRQGKVSELDLEMIGSNVKQEALELVGTYLKIEGGYFVFDHPSIYDSVAYNMCKLHTIFVIENCSLSFLHERLRLKLSETVNNETDLVVYISQPYAGLLARRFAAEIPNGNLNSTLSHQACRQPMFIDQMMSAMSLSPKDIIKKLDNSMMIPGSFEYAHFLFLSVSNGSPHLLKYIVNHTDIQLTQSDINTVLWGTCVYAASDVLTYLKETHILSINHRYGFMEQTPLMLAVESRDADFVSLIISLKSDLSAHDKHGRTALHYMCMHGVVSFIEQLYGMNIDINTGTEMKCGSHTDSVEKLTGTVSPLLVACRSNQLQVVRLLVDRGAIIDLKTLEETCHEGNTDVFRILLKGNISTKRPLCELIEVWFKKALKFNDMNMIICLVETGATINTVCGNRSVLEWLNGRDSGGNTPLHSAAQWGSAKFIDVLLKTGAEVNVQNRDGNTPLHNAAVWSSDKCIDMLLKAGGEVNVQNKDSNTPLHNSVERGSHKHIDMLLNAGGEVNVQNKDGNTPLHNVLKRESDELVDMLLTAGGEVNVQNKYGNTPLHISVERGSHKHIHMLLNAGGEVNVQNKDGNTPLHNVVEKDSDELVDMLLKAGGEVNVQNKEGNTPLHNAAEQESDELVDMLLNAGGEVNVQNKYGNTPLHISVERGSHKRIDMLLNAGGEVNVQNKNGNTPLHNVVERDSDELVDMLLKAGGGVNVQNKDGNTPLHIVAGQRSDKCVDTLLKAGFEVNELNKVDSKALYSASGCRTDKCIAVLLKAGAKVNVQNKYGKTPFQNVPERGSLD